MEIVMSDAWGGRNEQEFCCCCTTLLCNDISTCNNGAAHVEVLICADKIVSVRRVV